MSRPMVTLCFNVATVCSFKWVAQIFVFLDFCTIVSSWSTKCKKLVAHLCRTPNLQLFQLIYYCYDETSAQPKGARELGPVRNCDKTTVH